MLRCDPFLQGYSNLLFGDIFENTVTGRMERTCVVAVGRQGLYLRTF